MDRGLIDFFKVCNFFSAIWVAVGDGSAFGVGGFRWLGLYTMAVWMGFTLVEA